MQFNLADLFEAVADSHPQRQAVVCGSERLSYAELEAGANRLAHYLATRGVAAGDHVGLYLYNCPQYLEAMLACFKIRAVPININYQYQGEELQGIVDNAELVACIYHRQFSPRMAELPAVGDKLKVMLAVADDSSADAAMGAVDYAEAKRQQPAERSFAPRSEQDHFILYTGGTTGRPKGVVWPHKNLFFAALGGGGHFSPLGPCQRAEDIISRISERPLRSIALAPLMHGASWWFACIQLLAGNTLVLNHRRHFDGAQIWQLVAQQRCNILQIVGDAMAIPLLDALQANPGRWDLSSVFQVASGGAVFSPVKQQAFREHFPHAHISNSFGSSETGQMGVDSGNAATASGLANLSGSDALAVIIDQASAPRRARRGETGILARRGQLPLGYYKDAATTANSIVTVAGDAWLLSGDMAKLEDDGSITVFGRGANCINSGGEKIFPEEVEAVLKAHPSILDALVIGLPDARWGSRVCAVVQARQGAMIDLESIRQHCRHCLAAYKLPRQLHLVARLPRLASGKPDYRRASAAASADSDQAPAQ